MPDFARTFLPASGIYCLSRALILAILVSSETLLARRRRSGYEKHLLLFSASALLLLAELYVVIMGPFAQGAEAVAPAGVWVWHPILLILGLMGVAFCFDFTASRDHEMLRTRSKGYLAAGAALAAFGVLLTGIPFRPDRHVTSLQQLGFIALLLHGIQAAAFLLIAWKAAHEAKLWLSSGESRVLILGCIVGSAGAVAQLFRGPNEPFTTVAFTLLVAGILRGNYRRSEMAAARVSEDRATKMLLFHRITTQLKSSFDLPQLYEILMDSLIGNLGAESGAIYIAETPKGNLRPEFIHGPFPPAKPLPDWCPDDLKVIGEVVRRAEMAPGEGVVGKVAETGRPLYIYRSEDVERHYKWHTGLVKVRTTIALPLRSPEGVYGVVQLVNRAGGGAFSEEDIRFVSLLVEQAGLAFYNARLHAERLERQRAFEQMKIARDIQLRLIPRTLPEIAGLSIGAEYNPAQEVGGDYFDLYRIDHDHLGLVVFDVAGKGVPGALLMAITATFLKMAAPRSSSPAWVLNEVNAALSAEQHRGLYVTAVYGVLQLSTLKLTLCSAGHPDALIIGEGEDGLRRMNPGGAALGLLQPSRFRSALEQEEVRLRRGDTVILYTDGVIEARNAAGEEFGERRLLETARRYATRDGKGIAAGIGSAVQLFAGGEPQYDDTTVLAVKLVPPEREAKRGAT